MPQDPRETAFEFVERELNSERAATLGRAGRRIEAALVECRQAQEAMAAAPPDDAEAPLRYRQAYRHYVEARDQFCMYREALGLYDHRRVDEIYRPPRAL